VVISLLEVQKKGDEKFEVLLRRFNREVQQSGILTMAKTNRFFIKEINRSQKRTTAIRKNVIRKLRRGY
jgi:ribosomal protein S21